MACNYKTITKRNVTAYGMISDLLPHVTSRTVSPKWFINKTPLIYVTYLYSSKFIRLWCPTFIKEVEPTL